MIDHNPEKYTVELLKQWKKEHEDKYKNTQKEKVFRTPIPDGLLPRDNEVDKLFDKISSNRIYNLIGVGGSGKSSLAYLMIKNYKDLFNEIAYVVVNTDIKQNIADQLNRTLKFKLKKDLYLDVVSHLQENFKSELPNLLVLDINETADKDKIDNFITEILQDNLFLDGWKFLILTRENVDTRKRIPFHSLKDEDGFDFLKKLFLDRAGERYEDFGDFETLFKVIFYNPLLAEQLGIYLSNEPQTATIDDIITILYGTTFREEDMQGMSAQRHDETIVSFLKKLIVYDKLDKNEQTLLRHFVLWQSDYISYDVIADLLKGVFETDSVLKKVFKTLTSRSIIETTVNDDKVLCYKLHGLLAFSLREQIDFDEEDWSAYLSNVERIIRYSYYKFEPYVDCIGNSLCWNDITLDCALLNVVAIKLQSSMKFNYAFFLLYKSCILLKNHLSSDKDNLELQNAFAAAYHNKANLQKYFKNFELSKRYFEKAITIREHLPVNNSKYQIDLASSFIDYATLLKDHLESFEQAESNYEKAIAILNKMPIENYECKNAIAWAYNSLATLKDVHQNDSESAILYYKKAIAIEEQLPTEYRDKRNILAMSYYNLASIQQCTLLNYESAKNNYEKSIVFFEKYANDTPEYQNNKASAYNNLAYLQAQCKNFESAISNYEKAITIRRRLANDNPFFLPTFLKSEFGLIVSLCNSDKFEQAQSILQEIKPLAEKYLAANPNDIIVQELNQKFAELLIICSIS